MSVGSNVSSTVMSQILPLSNYGKTFALVATTYRGNLDVYTLVAVMNNTVIHLSNGNNITLHAGEYREINQESFPSEFNVIQSTEPISVYRFSPSGTRGFPAMTYIPPLNQWMSQYIFSTVAPTNYEQILGFMTSMTIVVAINETEGLWLNGQNLGN